MKIDFVSDIACPWCAVGLSSLLIALDRIDGTVPVQMHMQPYELNPDMAAEGVLKIEYLMDKYGISREQVLSNEQRLIERAAAVGFTITSDPTFRAYNTFDGHRLLHWAGLQNGSQQVALKQALQRAYFTEGRNPSDVDVLVDCAVEAGLPADKAREVVTTGAYADEVRAAETRWQRAGITSVPAVVLNGKYLISGGQPPEVFEQALRQVAEEELNEPAG